MQLPDSVRERFWRLACSYPLARVQFRLPDACDFYIYVSGAAKDYKVISEFGQADNPELTLEMENSTLSAILDGQLSGRHAFLLGDVQYSGNRELAAALAGLFPANSEEGDVLGKA
ncbi:SCP2 sterol-binding domain-containing protein [Microbulbifer sp. OS29]|uniref:SCP2 sterol-binding domain-containing protein n=1 Tax=Microbulbifer okhotskensis TaxID=2926617 RepID=A0A9X2EUI5_9GAMM|nr:SCP2 sterol-binding domain-containing protein [Microbulbifer okhotskensis]MCO1335808.1 SCP2 sterol-binding domain-containing protein [Microbulbifer okhotskensis]